MDWLLQTEPVKQGDVVITAGLGIGDELRSLGVALTLGGCIEPLADRSHLNK